MTTTPPLEAVDIAVRNIQTYIKLGDNLGDALAAVTAGMDAETQSALNRRLHALRAEYRALLKAHDWYFDFSDDSRKQGKGFGERNHLTDLQPIVDPTFDAWNACAPTDFRKVPA